MEPSSAIGIGPATGEAGRSTIFVSYSRDDLDFADQLAAGLKLCGFTPTVDRHAISGGEDWQARLRTLILEADTVVFVLSPKSAVSEVCAWEVEEAARLGKRIVPVVPRPLDGAAAPTRLQDLNYIFFYGEPRSPGTGFGAGLATLVAALRTDLAWLREHTRLLERAIDWDTGGRSPIRLLSGTDIASAKAWAAARPRGAPEQTALHLDYIRASEDEETSRASAERRRLDEIAAAQDERARALKSTEQALRDKAEVQQALREREEADLRTSRFNTRVAVLVAVGAIALAGWSVWNANEAWTAKKLATIAQQRAEEATYEATVNRSRALIQAARGQVEANKHWYGVQLAIEALDVDKARIGNRSFYLPEADKILAMHQLDEQLVGHQGTVTSLAVSKDGHTVVTGSNDESARVWKPIRSGRLGASVLTHPAKVSSVAMTPDGKTMATTAGDSLRIFDVSGLAEVQVITQPKTTLTSVALSPDGSLVSFGATDGSAVIANTATGVILSTIPGLKSQVTGVAFTPVGSRVVVGSRSSARVFEARTSAMVLELPSLHTDAVTSLAVSYDGRRIATGSEDATVRIWDASTGEALSVLRHTAPVTSLAFIEDGRLVTGSGYRMTGDSTVRVWAADGTSHYILGGHLGPVLAVAATADGNRIVSAADIGTADAKDRRQGLAGRAWVWTGSSTDKKSTIEAARKASPYCLSLRERAEFGLPPIPPAWCIDARKRPYNREPWGTPAVLDEKIAESYGLAFEVAICNLSYKDADIAATEAIRRQPDSNIGRLMVAISHMVNGRTNLAREQFGIVRQVAAPIPDGMKVKSWDAATLLIFRHLRACGISDPLMQEIEQTLAAPTTKP